MSEVEFGWVIRRDDGQYLVGGCLITPLWSDTVRNSELFAYKNPAIVLMRHLNLKDCKVVKIQMKVVEE